MKGLFFFLSIFVCTALFAESKDEFVGFYGGSLKGAMGYPLKYQSEIFAEVHRLDKGVYQMRLLSALFSHSETHGFVKNLKAKNGEILLSGGEAEFELKDFDGKITPKEITFTVSQKNKRISGSLKRLNLQSPTMGVKAPDGAKILFDGKDMSAWTLKDGREVENWLVQNGVARINKHIFDGKRRKNFTLVSKDKFEHMKLHLEFKLPCEYGNGRNTRGNSGVIFGGLYEIQILDSFASEGYWDECGSLYRQIPPQVNASFEVGAWQTFDIEYKPAKYEGKKLIDYPRFTVFHNGICVLRDAPVMGNTADNVHKYRGILPTDNIAENPQKTSFPKEAINITLQDHYDFIEFRNIWVLPIKD